MGYHDVGRLQVAVGYLPAVYVVEGGNQLFHYPAGHRGVQSPRRQDVGQGLAVHVFHDDGRAQSLHLLQAYRAADVGMVEPQPYLELL